MKINFHGKMNTALAETKVLIIIQLILSIFWDTHNNFKMFSSI